MARNGRTSALRLIGALALLVGIAVMLPAPSAEASPFRASPLSRSAGPWRDEPIPNPAVPDGGGMSSVSCTSATACIAVGSALDSADVRTAVAQGRRGSRWRLQTVPAPAGATASSLSGVSCTAAGACTAVGTYTSRLGQVLTLADRWNGTRWRRQAIPGPAGSGTSRLSAISCTATTACTAVGQYFSARAGATLPLAERWNGSRWAIQAIPGPVGAALNGLTAVSCTTADACTAVGSADHSGVILTLAEFWNGTSWGIQSTPNPAGTTDSGFSAVSCTSPKACIAAGNNESSGTGLTLAERWNGTSWTIQPTPNPAGTASAFFSGVSCPSAQACTAVGTDIGSTTTRALAEHWNGTTWSVQPTPSPGSFDTLSAVSCSSAQACSALGAFSSSAGEKLTLAATWNGARWALQATPNPAGAALASSLAAVSCPSARSCTAVGDYFGAAGHFVTLAEAQTGTRWNIQPTPDPAGSTGSYLTGVSCPSSRACIAVGYSVDHRGHDLTLAETWNGTRWRIQATPVLVGATGSQLSAVSCSPAHTCTAVGYSESGDRRKALIEAWDGTRWRIQPASSPAGSLGSLLTGVSCTAPGACTAVGYTALSAGREAALAEARVGTRWHIQPTPTPGRDNFSVLLPAVSCTVPRACTAVGSSQHDDDSQPSAFAEAWDGARWSIQSIPVPAGTVSSSLSGVSCSSAGPCTAVGAVGRDLGLTFAVTTSGG